jgi:hypothetical protein
MRQAVTEVDLEITMTPPPKLGGEAKPLSSGGATAEDIPEEAMPVTIDVESKKA